MRYYKEQLKGSQSGKNGTIYPAAHRESERRKKDNKIARKQDASGQYLYCPDGRER